MDEITTRDAVALTGVPYFTLLRRCHRAGVAHRRGDGRGAPILWQRDALMAALAAESKP